MMDFSVSKLSENVGVRLEGLTPSDLQRFEVVQEIKKLIFGHGLVVIDELGLKPDEHIQLAHGLGEIVETDFLKSLDDYPVISEIRKEASQKRNIGGTWHTDHSCDHHPAMGSILVGREVPTTEGNTEFASLTSAVDMLSNGLREMLRGVNLVHTSREAFDMAATRIEANDNRRLRNSNARNKQAIHPAIIQHPVTGQEALYINPDFSHRFEGWTKRESKALLEYLYSLTTQPENTCSITWSMT